MKELSEKYKAPTVPVTGAEGFVMGMHEIFSPRFVAWMRLQPKLLGRKRCRKVGVGGMIRELRSMVPENGTGEYVSEARRDLHLLESACKLCGKCRDICGP